MAGRGGTRPGGLEQKLPGVTLTRCLLAARSRPGLGGSQRPAGCSEEQAAPQAVRLDREDICAIGRLGSLQEIHSLYLQRNRIEKIENLACFPNLRFLSLAGNCIRKVENLQPLQHLRFLDLSQNQIQTLDPDELPRSLRLLDLTGNECTQQPGYRELVVGALPHLLQLDTQPLHGCVDPAPGEEEEEEGSSSSEDSDDELFSEPSAPFTAGKDFFADLHQELARRSRRRQGEALDEHQTRLQELRGLLLPPALGSAGTETCRAPSPGSGLSPRRSLPRPHAKPGPRPPPSPGHGRQHARSPQPGPADSRSQPRAAAVRGETHSKGAEKRGAPQTPSTAPQSGLKPLYSYKSLVCHRTRGLQLGPGEGLGMSSTSPPLVVGEDLPGCGKGTAPPFP